MYSVCIVCIMYITCSGVGGGATAGCLQTAGEAPAASKLKNNHEGTNKVSDHFVDGCVIADS